MGVPFVDRIGNLAKATGGHCGDLSEMFHWVPRWIALSLQRRGLAGKEVRRECGQ